MSINPNVSLLLFFTTMPVSPGGAAARRLSALGHHMHARASSAGPQTENDVDWEVFANGW